MSVIETPPPSSTVKRKMRAQVRALPEEGQGQFEALVSAYNVEYNVGFGWSETIAPGAFADSIAEQNGAVPVMYEHQWGQAPVGDAIASESSMGLIVRGQLYIDTDPFVMRIWNAMNANALREYSIAFFPLSFDWDPDNPTLDIVTRGELIEASICVRGANPSTETLDLRSAPVYLDSPKKETEEEVERLRSLRKRSFVAPKLRSEESANDPKVDPTTEPEVRAVDADTLDAAIMRNLGRIVRSLVGTVDSGGLKLSSSADQILRALASFDSASDDDTDPDDGDDANPDDDPDDTPAGNQDDPDDPDDGKEKETDSKSDRSIDLSSPWARDMLRKQFASAKQS